MISGKHKLAVEIRMYSILLLTFEKASGWPVLPIRSMRARLPPLEAHTRAAEVRRRSTSNQDSSESLEKSKYQQMQEACMIRKEGGQAARMLRANWDIRSQKCPSKGVLEAMMRACGGEEIIILK